MASRCRAGRTAFAPTGTTSTLQSRSRHTFIESLNDRLRDAFPNETLFMSLAQARVKREERRRDYNSERSQSVLGNWTPIA
jgi:hypothetical protein